MENKLHKINDSWRKFEANKLTNLVENTGPANGLVSPSASSGTAITTFTYDT